MKVSRTLWDVFQAAVEAENNSDGLVSAAVLDAMVNAGYDRSFDLLVSSNQGNVPAATNPWKMTGSLSEVTLDDTRQTICLPADMHLDFGGVAKGWAAQQAAQKLAEIGPALVSAGGDIAISAEQSNGEPWPVTIDDPFNPGEFLNTLMLRACGVATSGKDYRRWKQGGMWNHHIIDPRSGQPAQTDIVAATIIAPTAMMAEMAAKAVLICGSQRGLEWIEARPELSGMLVLETGEIINSNLMEQYFWRSK